ncbi:hypothetical protein [Bacillus sp. FJAT-28004]|uniref:hypothetical protein n=1 Tax=Bacillus sp. FJAT-28004 TaxID=1679165 RepID=UPI0006B58AFE|nr:hypothetical protein [Bacillus sp. FJAT-28004]
MDVDFCTIEGCSKAVKAKGWCAMHHQRYLRYGNPYYVRPNKNVYHRRPIKPMRSTRLCELNGCDRVHAAKGMCRVHYNANKKES